MDKKKNIHISVVSPVYGCSTSLIELYIRLKDTLSKITNEFEIILVNDGSPDDAWAIISELCHLDNKVKGINLSRNFGQHYAITAGLDHCKGEWVVVMDCDLQDQPEEIIKLYTKAQEGWEIVVGKREKRKDSLLKKGFATIFYFIYNNLSENRLNPDVANFGIYSKQVISYFNLCREDFRSFGLMVNSVGFKRFELTIDHAKRKKGKTTYTYKKRVDLAIDNILSNTDKPLRILFKIGLMISILSILCIMVLIYKYFFMQTPLPGWTSLIVSLFFLCGLIIASIGFIGLYIGKIFIQVKQRPLYMVQEKINLN